MHDGDVAVEGEEKGVGHRDRGKQQLKGPRVRVHVVVDLGCNSIDILNFGHKTGCETGPYSGTTSVLGL